MKNPFASRATTSRAKYNRLAKPATRDLAMEEAFPLGTGYGRRGAGKRLDSHIDRAVQTEKARKDAEWYKANAAAFDRGEINAQGRAPAKDAGAAAERRARLDARMIAAELERAGKEQWQVRGSVIADSSRQFGGAGRKLILAEHRDLVEWALFEGLDVPADVLTDYPDLQAAAEWRP